MRVSWPVLGVLQPYEENPFAPLASHFLDKIDFSGGTRFLYSFAVAACSQPECLHAGLIKIHILLSSE